jgi:DNA-directed RNA polymerase subunit L
VSQCSYEYTPDNDEKRIEAMFMNWLSVSKKTDKLSKQIDELQREFYTMQIKRCFKINEKGEPYSFNFMIETIGVLSVDYIVQRACQVGENMCDRYANLANGDLPTEITITSSDSRIIGYDFLIRGHDHTLGNLLQTWLVENHIEGTAEPKITYAGYSIPHPLRDEMVLRIGVEDGEEIKARRAFAEAARGCSRMFSEMLIAWKKATTGNLGSSPTISTTKNLIRKSQLQKK